jgi:hypothetical protein
MHEQPLMATCRDSELQLFDDEVAATKLAVSLQMDEQTLMANCTESGLQLFDDEVAATPRRAADSPQVSNEVTKYQFLRKK